MIKDKHPNRSHHVDGKRYIGYWDRQDEPIEYVDLSWDSKERRSVTEFLKSGRTIYRWRGSANCRICGERIGSTCMSDGLWVWPEGLAHYVAEHSLRPPQEFVGYVMRTLARDPLQALTEDKVRALAQAMGSDPDMEAQAVEQTRQMRVLFETLHEKVEGRDLVLQNHFREIIQFGCDILSYAGMDFDPLLLRGVLNMAVGLSEANKPGWFEYTRTHAPIVNQNLIEKESPKGGLDS